MQRLSCAVRNDLQADFPAAFHNTSDGDLVARETAPVAAGLAADPRFVSFDHGAVKRLVTGVSHRRANPVTEIPRGLVGNANGAFDLVCRNPLFRFQHDVGREKPFPQRQFRVMQNRPGHHGKLIAA